MTDELFFPPFDASAAMWPLTLMILLLVGIMSGFFFVCVVAANSEFSLRSRLAGGLTGVALIAVCVTAGVAAKVEGDAREVRYQAIRDNRTAFVEDRGVFVPDSQWENLDFPADRPTEDERFGIAQAEYDGKVVTVRLAWEDGELKLYRTDGEELLPVN
jgi:hypothetical protein